MAFLIVKLKSRYSKSHFPEKTMAIGFTNFSTLYV